MHLCDAPAPSPQILQLGWHQAEGLSNGDQRRATLYLEYAKYFTFIYIYIFIFIYIYIHIACDSCLHSCDTYNIIYVMQFLFVIRNIFQQYTTR